MRCLIVFVFLTGLALPCQAAIHLAQGLFSGEVTDTTVLLQTRLTATPGLDANEDVPGAAGVACFEWAEDAGFAGAARSSWLPAVAERDFIVRAQVTGLKPGTPYHFRVVFGADEASAQPGIAGRFKTLPGAGAEAPVTFIMGSCMNYNKFMYGKKAKASGPITATDEDKRLGFPAFATMAAMKPDFFIGTGDIVYYDNIVNGPAQTLPELRQCWHEQFRFPRLTDFFRQTPAYWSKDDHDFRFNDSDLTGVKLPLPQTGIDLFREQMPLHPAGDRDSPSYRTHRVNKHLQLWFTEGRDHRSPNKMEDGPDKTLWGSAQRQWLQRTLKASDATWKLLISPTPMVGPDDASKKDNHVNLGGFRHEADAFFAWIKEQGIERFFTFCGDRHWQYHSVHPSGVEEFACGALNDENARVGVAPGSRKGTDPEALIRQIYTYPEPTGGFIRVSAGGNLSIEFFDDQGQRLHAVEKAR
jgi:alkaline phosphatase D